MITDVSVAPGLEAATLPLRERKKLRTRRALEEAALRLFRERGFDATTVEAIAAAAEVSPRTFARYFGSKEEAAVGHPGEWLAQFRAMVAGQPEDRDEFAVTVSALVDLARLFEEEREILLDRAALARSVPVLRFRLLEWEKLWQGALAEELARRKGLTAPDLRIRILAAVGIAALGVAVLELVDGRGRPSLPATLEGVLDVLLLDFAPKASAFAATREATRQAARGRRSGRARRR
jgi:AcrR family transcriptional regulator